MMKNQSPLTTPTYKLFCGIVAAAVLMFAGSCNGDPENSVTLSSAKAITGFVIAEPDEAKGIAGVIDEQEKTISLAVPSSVDAYQIKAEITHTGKSISPNPAGVENYSDPVTYTVTAEDGGKAVYTVELRFMYKVATLKQFEVEGYSLTPPFAPDTDTRDFTLNVPDTLTSVTLLAAVTDDTGATIPEDQKTQIIDISSGSGTASVTVTSEDGTVTGTYTLTVATQDPAKIARAFTVGDVTFFMNYVPAGSFQRDATAGNDSVITRPYRMAETEVSNALFYAVMSKVQDDSGAWVTDTTITRTTTGNNPAGQMNFYWPIAFCNKLSLMTGKTPVYSVAGITDWGKLKFNEIPVDTGSSSTKPRDAAWDEVVWDDSADGFRLPTEMEFIWAAMGADYSAPGQKIVQTINSGWWAGKELGLEYAECGNDSGMGGMKPVRSQKPNSLGIYNLTGNVGEIIWDRNNTGDSKIAWPAGTLTDYKGLSGAGDPWSRMVKGGSASQAMGNSQNLTFNDVINPPIFARWGGNGFRVASNN